MTDVTYLKRPVVRDTNRYKPREEPLRRLGVGIDAGAATIDTTDDAGAAKNSGVVGPGSDRHAGKPSGETVK